MTRAMVAGSAEGAGPIVPELGKRGVDALVEPVLRVETVPGPPLDLTGTAALLLTSPNGVRAVARRTADRFCPVLAVGDSTARAAAEAGFGHVESAGGDVSDLFRLVLARCPAEAGGILHAAGEHAAGDLAGRLERAGYRARRETVYRTVRTDRISDAARAALTERSLELALFLSRRGAAAFSELVVREGLGDLCGEVRICTMSAAVLDAVRGLQWAGVHIAASPTRAGLMAAVDAALARPAGRGGDR